MAHAARAITAVLLILGGTVIEAGALEGAACPSRKVKATAKKVESALKCHDRAAARGTPADPACLAKVATKFAAAFASAEASPPCFAAGDAGAIGTAADVFLDGVVTILRPNPTASKCASRKLKASAKKTAKRLACHQRAIQQGAKVVLDCLGKETVKFGERVASAEELPDCLTTGDTAAIETTIDAYVDDTVAALRPVPPSSCTARKLAVTGAIGRRTLLCHAEGAHDGVAVDPGCLADEEEELLEELAQAEGVVDCLTTGEAAMVAALLDGTVDAVAAQLRPSAAQSQCTTAKLVFAGRVYERLLDCRAVAIRDGLPLIPRCVTDADDAITEGFPSEEEEEVDCLTTGDAATVLATVVVGVSSVEGALLP